MTDRWAQLTCGFRITQRDPECGARPQWRLTSPLRRDWDPGTSPFFQQYACAAHLERAVEQYGERDVEVVFEPLDDVTVAGAPLVESRRSGQPLSEQANWIMSRTDRLVADNWNRSSAYMQAAREWFAGHPENDSAMTRYRLWCTGSDPDGWLEFSEEAAREAVMNVLKEWAHDELLHEYDTFGDNVTHCPEHGTFSNECEDCIAEEYDRVYKLMDRDMARRLERLWGELVRDGYAEVVEGDERIAFSVDIIKED